MDPFDSAWASTLDHGRTLSPRAVLRSMIGGRSIRAFSVDAQRKVVEATVTDLGPDEVETLCQGFEREAGMPLRLTAQLGFGF